MALPFRTPKGVVGIHAETVAFPNNWFEPSGSECFHAVNIQFTPTQQIYERKDTSATMTNRDAITGAGEGDISFEIPLVGCPNLTGPAFPFWHTAMMACGHSAVGVNNTSITYKPTNKIIETGGSLVQGVWPAQIWPVEGYSVGMWCDDKYGQGGLQFMLSGCMGNVAISTKQGEPLIAKFKFHGAYQVVANDNQPSFSDSTLTPPSFLGATVSVHGVNTLAFDGFDFDKGNTLSKRGDVSATWGYRGAWVTAQKPMIKISPELVTTTVLDMFGRWKNGTTGNFIAAAGTAGSGAGTAGGRFTFTAGRTQFRDMALGDREGAVTADLGLAITTDANAADGADYTLQIT